MQTGRQIEGFWKSSDTEYWSTELEYDRKKINMTIIGVFPGCTEVKTSSDKCRKQKRHGYNLEIGKILWRRKWQPIPVFLPEKSTDRGAWRATVHGVAKNHTQRWNRTHTKVESIWFSECWTVHPMR